MKTCSKCKVEKESSEFYKDKHCKDGLCCRCKLCMREYENTKAGIEVRRRYRSTTAGKETCRKAEAKYHQLNPEKRKAMRIVRCALDAGRLIRPDHCEMCFIVCRPEGHHEDYSKQLEVDWLCTRCHNSKGVKV